MKAQTLHTTTRYYINVKNNLLPKFKFAKTAENLKITASTQLVSDNQFRNMIFK